MSETYSETYWLFRPFVSAVNGWCKFWFTPADPTMLGFLRFCTGLVLLHILICSGPLLSSFYSPDGWIDTKAADVFRKQTPWSAPEAGWEDGAPLWFVQMDKNKDGVVTQREWAAVRDWNTTRLEFEYIDREKAGKITVEQARDNRMLWLRPWANANQDSQETFENWGMYPAYALEQGQPFFSPFFHLESAAARNTLHILSLIVTILFTFGVGTRVTSVVAWVLALSYVHRVPGALFGMDTMLGIMMLYLMIAPAGAALSVDRWIRVWWLRKHGLPVSDPTPSVTANVATRLIQVHLCIIYFIAGLSKMQGAAWWNGTSIWQILTNYEFTPRSELFTWTMRMLTYNRWVWEIFHTASAWGTLALEVSLPFLIWDRRWRWLMICGSVCMHVFISLTMGLTAFQMLMICMVFTWVPTDVLKGMLAWFGGLWERLTRSVTAPVPAATQPEQVVAQV